MAKPNPRKKPACSHGLLLLSATLFVLLLIWTLSSNRFHLARFLHSYLTDPIDKTISNGVPDSPDKTFYDDPELSYSIEKPLKNWDEKRRKWLQLHPSLAAGAQDRILLVTGSQPSPCKNRIGDHLLLRAFKNKVDYCRIHGHVILYNNLYLHPKMDSYWAKIPIIRASMLAHPEVEWIWWVDADAIFTDMEFKLPIEKYRNHNMVVHGWPKMVYGDKHNKSWTGLNAGLLLLRNCQWSMDLMKEWAKMGPISAHYEKWGKILKSAFKDKPFPLPDDQSSLIYLLFTERERWEEKTYLEWEYDLEAYWVGVVEGYEEVGEEYKEMEEEEKGLRRRHSEKESAWYGRQREDYMKRKGVKKRRAFMTHFTGCQPCSGDHNPSYDGEKCWKEMERALNFGDNQVIRNYGYIHNDLHTSSVSLVPYDYPWFDLY
ncbi:glycosyltransferase 6-like [Prosopis cineraria]|uniref:glycosyltransferase 6-like n=1 Tax=Prosopis cineraria TaxID=364024 RepID=UPI0024106C4E|nr:glycosyltransferase 6-like [Prosopis cineraria]